MLWINLLLWSVIARALMSFLPIDQGSTIYQVLWRITEPIIDPFRRVMPNTGMIDLSPLAAIIMLIVMAAVVSNLATMET